MQTRARIGTAVATRVRVVQLFLITPRAPRLEALSAVAREYMYVELLTYLSTYMYAKLLTYAVNATAQGNLDVELLKMPACHLCKPTSIGAQELRLTNGLSVASLQASHNFRHPTYLWGSFHAGPNPSPNPQTSLSDASQPSASVLPSFTNICAFPIR